MLDGSVVAAGAAPGADRQTLADTALPAGVLCRRAGPQGTCFSHNRQVHSLEAFISHHPAQNDTVQCALQRLLVR